MISISLSQALEGFELHTRARRLSEHTILDYFTTYRKLQEFLDGDPLLSQVTSGDIERFLASRPVSAKTLLNYHAGLSALWTWAVRSDLAAVHVIRLVERPRPEQRAIVPYTEADVRAMLAALKASRLYKRPGKRHCANTLANQERNRALILLLLDTGMRASELCALRIHQTDPFGTIWISLAVPPEEASLPL